MIQGISQIYLFHVTTPNFLNRVPHLMEYITLCLDSTNEIEQWYVMHNCFIVLYQRLHVSTYIQVIFRPFFLQVSP